MDEELDPDTLLRAYALGIFPMSDGRGDADLHWIDPRRRGILPLDGFHMSRSLERRLRRADYRLTADQAFAEVVIACADRQETWISHRIQRLYQTLHDQGHAHSIEVWQDDTLAGGVYGVTLGAAFFGESMFSRATDASKVALAFAVHRLRAGGFRLFDTQFLTPHLASLGGIEISRAEYHRRLAAAVAVRADFAPVGYSPTPLDVAGSFAASGSTQDSTQTS
ncbi:leucyl/phenylalanyl-tRNA--protein transferase [Tabrizicola sp.]|uniref:leucyl/phenylalanyl-tRNA--protein transferase n=1 Tax=Tabrizicola sp. TaxID=2005166 RepID=UPI0025EDD8E7|nr:leucyl/phenylalanyl-tRNA--protein transferase [Tabrizicola sp.]MBY0351135.1 leucyl/phenylalanyl-tRNA--protein transferase [Tabrizicola sp.]MDK2774702.1 leucyl/phenylalanyl-tRNA--protein transferase [Tabrizicola sp.]